MNEEERPYHPLANKFPLVQGEEYDNLKNDIAVNGQIEPIWLHEDGSIIDGRNRHRACIELDRRPVFREWGGNGSLLSFIVSLNLHRRHLTSSQRAAIALDVLPMLEEEARGRQGVRNDLATSVNSFTEVENGGSSQQAANLFGTNRQYIIDAKSLEKKAPDLLEKVRNGKKTIPAAKKELRKRQKEQRKSEVPPNLPANIDKRWNVFRCGIEEITSRVEVNSIDHIITDPPYPKEYLCLYEELAKVSARILKPGGSLLVMCGQSYLPEIFNLMTPHMTYQWTVAYLTPGGQSPQIWNRKVNTFWKPVLWFVNGDYEGDWIGDVSKSNGNDKAFHHWGQSESGMADIIERFTYPGQTVLDPFCGGGTTGFVAVKLNRMFIGSDISGDAIKTTEQRLLNVSK